MMNARKGCLLGGGIFLLVVGLMVCVAGGWWGWEVGRPRLEQPSLRVFQPSPNSNLSLRVPVVVQASATAESSSIVWLRFYADQLLSGEQRGSANELIGTWSWTPVSAGAHTLAFVASTEQGVENLITLPVTVLPAVDRDSDGLPDDLDACPDQPAAPASQGCPLADDDDGDGVADAQDACPQEAGSAEQHGCSMANRPDMDRDGTPDWEDHCPTESGIPQWNGCPQDTLLTDGDADGLVDAVDDCPQQPGAQDNRGCPAVQAGDRDGDGVADDQDGCPEQGGSARDGCPLISDHDRDGIADEEDACPDNPNPNFACMDVNQTDADGDGIWDILDDCRGEYGVLDNNGCPLPSDRDGDGVADDQDNCDDRLGPAENSGCPVERNYPRKGEVQNIFCRLFPDACTSGDVDCNADPAACGLPVGCPYDNDCDGIPNEFDSCPDQFGFWMPSGGDQGCPADLDEDGNPDPDQDHDGVPDARDSCNQPGLVSNAGCPREEVDLSIFLRGFLTNNSYSNFYCYIQLQNWDWIRIPEAGSLARNAGRYYEINQSISLHLAGNEKITYHLFCEGQADPLSPVQRVGTIIRSHGPESWNSTWIDAISDNGQLSVEYQICEGSCE